MAQISKVSAVSQHGLGVIGNDMLLVHVLKIWFVLNQASASYSNASCML